MVVKPPASIKPKFGPDTFLPALLSFGPACMFIGLRAGNSHDRFAFSFAAIGTFLLALGLGLLFTKQVRLERRLDALEREKE